LAKHQTIESLFLQNHEFRGWIEGKASEEVHTKWSSWLEKQPDFKDEVHQLQEIHRHLHFNIQSRTETEQELARLHQTLSKKEAQSSTKRSTVPKKLIRFMPKIAAAILLIITATVVYNVVELGYLDSEPTETVVQELITTTTENGQKKILTLSDGSVITLNANSRLTYPAKSLKGDLEVWMEGEAFFEIVSSPNGEERSFKVHMPNGQLSVLGTTFNINSYRETTEVFLKEGSVKLELRDEQNRVKDTYLMKPGQLSRLSETEARIQSQWVRNDILTSWTNDNLVFENATLAEISQRLGDIYDVNIELKSEKYRSILISGSLPNNNLSVFIKALENIVGDTISVQGTTLIVGEENEK
jgi:ferric-dicitrate binding protein FerR (iron transport regulator)